MKKKWIPAVVTLSLIGAMTVSAFAAAPQTTLSEQAQTHPYPIVVNGQDTGAGACVMVPLRAVAEPLGFTVTWRDGSVLVDNGVIHTTVTIGVDQYCITTSNESLVGMSAPFSLGTPPYVTNGVTYVPLGLFRALLGNREDAVSLDENRIVIQSEQTELANPFVTCQTMAQAESLAGFSLELPDQVPCGDGQAVIRAVNGAMIEVIYQSDTEKLVVRKGAGSQDISGDYQKYETQRTVTVDDRQVTIKGTGNTVAVAIWADNGYTYAVSAAPGLETAELSALISGIR